MITNEEKKLNELDKKIKKIFEKKTIQQPTNNKFLISTISAILIGLSTWVLIQVVELRTTQGMIMQELLNIDKQMGRIYAHMDRLMNK
tara:strand:- start:204 stop:467 length:264 start_codon:yes stop_codon:yes gene_type:complete